MTNSDQSATATQCSVTSADPPIADAIPDMVALTLRARSGREQMQRREASLLDHLVSEREQCRRYLKPKRLHSFQIDHELEFSGSDDRQVGRALALKNPSDIDTSLAICICN